MLHKDQGEQPQNNSQIIQMSPSQNMQDSEKAQQTSYQAISSQIDQRLFINNNNLNQNRYKELIKIEKAFAHYSDCRIAGQVGNAPVPDS